MSPAVASSVNSGAEIDLALAYQFVKCDRNCLPEIHGHMFVAGGNVDQPVAVAEFLVAQTELLRSEEQRDRRRCELLTNESRAFVEPADGVLQIAVLDRGGSDDQCTIGDSFSQASAFLGAGQQGRSTHSGTGFAKRQFVRIDHAEPQESEVAHGARGGTDIEWIARCYQHHAQAIEFNWTGTRGLILRHWRRMKSNSAMSSVSPPAPERRSSDFRETTPA